MTHIDGTTDVPVTGAQPLRGRRALVTGGISGIGKACVERLVTDGASVVINYRGEESRVHDLLTEMRARGGEVIALAADMRSEEEIVAMFEAATHRLGAIDLLVNNAGMEEPVALVDMTLDQWNAVIETNLTGPFLCSREAAKAMIATGRRGTIVNVSSVHEKIPWPCYSHYCASKGGLKLLAQSLARELTQHGIRVVNVAPGAIATPMNQQVLDDPQQREEILGEIPMDRMGTPEEIAAAVSWLASDQAAYITGETLFVDGGMQLYPGVTK